MKKHFNLGLIFGLLIGLFLGSAAIAMATTPVKLIVNGEDITYKSDVPPQIINGRTLVPARALAEALGATVTWDTQNNAVIVTSINKTVTQSGNTRINDWITSRELIDNYSVIKELLAGKELEILGKNKLLVQEFNYQNLSEGVYNIESNLGTLVIKKENSRLYFSINNLKALGVL